ncbi:hypothetical protein E4H12_16040 [Candidatus Thorarchaeota archaeon]|nr:MAG: hypothetical protein E4H12_16040 [Candidatus Thorarchaeota archaeon]
MSEIPAVDLWKPEIPCELCGDPADEGYSVPMYEGKIVNEEETDDWAGVLVCRKCYESVYGG